MKETKSIFSSFTRLKHIINSIEEVRDSQNTMWINMYNCKNE